LYSCAQQTALEYLSSFMRMSGMIAAEFCLRSFLTGLTAAFSVRARKAIWL
jgi:hypothetical protein